MIINLLVGHSSELKEPELLTILPDDSDYAENVLKEWRRQSGFQVIDAVAIDVPSKEILKALYPAKKKTIKGRVK